MIEARRLLGGARVAAQWIDFAPQPESWLDVGAQNWIWGSLAAWPPIRDLRFGWEHELGIGLLDDRRLPRRRLARRGVARRSRRSSSAPRSPGLVALRWPGGFTLWTRGPRRLARRRIGARHRSPLARPARPGRDRARRGPRPRARVAEAPACGRLLAAVVLLEQQRGFDSASVATVAARVEPLAALVPDDCPSFFWSPRTWGMTLTPETTQLDAMWAALRLGKPTVNGWASYAPPGWYALHEHGIPSPQRRAELRGHLSFWALRSGLPRGEICWVLSRQGPQGLEPAGLERVDPALSPWPAAAAVAAGALP